MSDTVTVKPGGGYVEDPNFVPNAGDMRKQFNTSGLGASGKIEETSAVFDLDKAQTAEQISRALDPDDTSVSSDKVLLPEGPADPEAARKEIQKAAKARLKKPVVVGGPSPLEEVAAEKGDDNPTKKDAAATDGPRAEAGGSTHTAPQAPAGSAGSGSTTPASADGSKEKEAKKSASSSSSSGSTAKKTTSSSSSGTAKKTASSDDKDTKKS